MHHMLPEKVVHEQVSCALMGPPHFPCSEDEVGVVFQDTPCCIRHTWHGLCRTVISTACGV